MPNIPYIPPELRRHIALFCDKSTLARLLPVDRLWAAECEPVLYCSIGLQINRSQGVALSCLDVLSSSPRKAALVKTFLIVYLHTPPTTVTDLVHKLLFRLRNLVDLRIRAPDAPEEGSDAKLLELLARPDCPFSLHTLHLPLANNFYPDLVCAALKAHANTLSVLGIPAITEALQLYAGRIAEWASLLRPSCANFAFSREPTQGRGHALFIFEPDTVKISSIAISLIGDPSGDLSPAMVDSLDFQLAGLPDAALAMVIGTTFPRAKFVRLRLPSEWAGELDPKAIAQAVAPLPHLFLLQLTYGLDVAPQIPTRTRVAIARAVFSAGCSGLYEVHFPDISRLRFHAAPSDGRPSSWYDPATLSDGETEDDGPNA